MASRCILKKTTGRFFYGKTNPQKGSVRGLRQVRQGVPCLGDYHSGGGPMKKKWHDYLWIFSLIYLILGFFNILFA